MTAAAAVAVSRNPFPGLRPFHEDEEHLFFGRESQIDAMVDKLSSTRFLAVVGTSGSGKSSLVNCGLRPALHRGLMARGGTVWRTAQFRPGGKPLRAMAHALAEDGVLFRDYRAAGLTLAEIVDTTLRMSKLGLIDIYEQAHLGENANLLVVVDQFEELFRYRQLAAGKNPKGAGAGEEATAFVNLLLEAAGQTVRPIYVVLTMRSDFLGDCAQFPGLAEAINAGQYLVPRMTRDERRAAIRGPVGVGGAEIGPVLLTRLVNDVGDNPDQLSILQHALNRTWAYWQHEGRGDGPLDLTHYQAIGSMAGALDRHAEKAYAELATPRRQQICEKLFKALTDKATDPRGVRRPTALGTLSTLTDATAAEITEVMAVFRKPSRSFLMPPAGDALHEDTVIDISHESLMRVWKRLDRWADEEAHSARTYRRLADTAVLHAAGEASLWRDPDLHLALDWRDRDQPNETWAQRYGGGFDLAMEFLGASEAKRRDEKKQEEQARQLELEQAHAEAERERKLAAERAKWIRKLSLLSAGMAGLILIAAGLGFWVWRARENMRLVHRAHIPHALVFESFRASERGDHTRSALLARQAYSLKQQMRSLSTSKLEVISKHLIHNGIIHNSLQRALDPELFNHELRGHESVVRTVAFSQDGTWLASGSGDHTVKVWRARAQSETGRKVFYQAACLQHEDVVRSVAFSPDSEWLAITGTKAVDGAHAHIRLFPRAIWALEVDGEPECTGDGEDLPVEAGWVRSIAFHPNRSDLLLAAGDRTGRVSVWRAPDGAAGGWRPLAPLETRGDVRSLAFSPDRRWLAAGDADGELRLWHLGSGEAGALGFSQLAEHRGLREHQLENKKEKEKRVRAVAFGKMGDELWLASAGPWQNGEEVARGIIFWKLMKPEDCLAGPDAENGSECLILARKIPHESLIRSLAFDPAGRTLFASSSAGEILAWDLEALEAVAGVAPEPALEEPPVDAEDTEREPVEAPDEAEVRALGALEPEILEGHNGWVFQVIVSPAGALLASAGEDRTVRLWEWRTEKAAGETPSPEPVDLESTVRAIRFDPLEHGRVVIAGGDGEIRLSDFAGGKIADTEVPRLLSRATAGGTQSGARLPAHDGVVRSIAISPDSRLLASGSDQDGVVRLWSLEGRGRELQTLELIPRQGVGPVVFSPPAVWDNKRWLAAGGYGPNPRIQLWDVRDPGDPRPLATMEPWIGDEDSAAAVRDLAFSPDGRMLAAATWSGRVLVRNLDRKGVPSKPRYLSFRNEKGETGSQSDQPYGAVAFSPEGRWLAAGSWGGSVRLWNLDQETTLWCPAVELKGDRGDVAAITFSPDGALLASGHRRGEVLLWDVPPFASGSASGSECPDSTSSQSPVIFAGQQGKWVLSVEFSPDGRWLLAGGNDQLVRTWTVTQRMAERVCERVTRNLTRQEWRELVGPRSVFEYQCTCPELPCPEAG